MGCFSAISDFDLFDARCGRFRLQNRIFRFPLFAQNPIREFRAPALLGREAGHHVVGFSRNVEFCLALRGNRLLRRRLSDLPCPVAQRWFVVGERFTIVTAFFVERFELFQTFTHIRRSAADFFEDSGFSEIDSGFRAEFVIGVVFEKRFEQLNSLCVFAGLHFFFGELIGTVSAFCVDHDDEDQRQQPEYDRAAG